MSVRKIAVISDTHGKLREELLEALQGAEQILHGGDICAQPVLDKLSRIAPVTAVRGNGDKDWAEYLPAERLFELYGKKIYMIHNKKQMSAAAESADIILFGHSHKYLEEWQKNGQLLLNPGTCGPVRPGKPVTMAFLEFDTDAGTVKVKKVELNREKSEKAPAPAKEADLRDAVELVVRDLKKGKTVEEIIKTRGIRRELAEQICQIYFTHPGIDVQGIRNRIEIAGL